MVRKRTLLLTVAGLLCAAAVYAIGVLAVGRFGSTQARIVGTTALLAAFSLLAFPAVVLTEQRRAPRLALATATVAGAGAVLAITALWWPSSVTGRAALTGAVVAAAVTQSAALSARRSSDEPPHLRHLYRASVVTAVVLAAMLVVQIWGSLHSPGYGRAIGVMVVLDALVVALQPVLGRLRPPAAHYRLRLTLETEEAPLLDVDAPDLAAAAAKAIHEAERRGGHVRRLEVEAPVRPR